jgi:hypothetical protein
MFVSHHSVPREPDTTPNQLALYNKFSDFNRNEVDRINRSIVNVLLGRRFKFTFNPATGKSKTVTFNPDGTIGEGKNNNEHGWRV